VDERPSADGDQLGHELSLGVVMFHQAVAQRLGVSASEHKVLDMVARSGGLTPGAIARESRLSGPAVTKIVDRLVRVGYAARVPHDSDGRSVLVVLTDAYHRVAWPATRGLAERIQAMNKTFTAEEQATIARWLTGVIAALRDETESLNS
jgi:DNA-binding MarR family transcriptional regulator